MRQGLAPGPLFFNYAAMRLTFHGSVLILGGSSELGRALALALRAEGAQVCCVCHDDAGCVRCAQDGLPALVLADPETLPARCEALLGQPVGHLADLLHSRFEQLVAMAAPEAIERWADDDIALRARCLRAVSRAMLARRFGRCVFVSSSAAQRPSPGQGWYAAAKLAGEGLYRSLGVELAGRGLSACSARLSWLDAGRGRQFLSRHGQVARAMPAGRCLGPDDVLPGLCFLLSAEAAAINGSVMTLDGGLGALKLPEL